MSGLEQCFFALWTLSAGHAARPEPVREYRFDPSRRWRFDFAWPELRVAVELCGVLEQTSKYRRAQGLTRFTRKLNAAGRRGWLVLLYTSLDLRERPADVIDEVARTLRERAELFDEFDALEIDAARGARRLTTDN